MTIHIHLDFETYSTVDIKKAGSYLYSIDPSTEILCVAYAIDGQPVKLLKPDDLHNIPYFINTQLFESDFEPLPQLFIAHNANFEFNIYHNILVKKYRWPEKPLRQWRCTAAIAAANALPRSLEKCSKALNLPIKKNMAGKRVMLKLSKPRTPTKNNPSIRHNKKEDYDILYNYCQDDVEVERHIYEKLRPLNATEQKVYFLDQDINSRGVQIDIDAVNKSLEIISTVKSDTCNAMNKFGFSPSQIDKALQWLKNKGVDLPDLKKDTVTKALKSSIPDEARTLLMLRQQVSKTSTAKFQSFRNSVDEKGRMRDMFRYHGASTGRWSGQRVQLHNLPRGSIADIDQCISELKTQTYQQFKEKYHDVMDALSSCLRGMIVAKEGHRLFVADYASIEARVALWFVDDRLGIRQYENKEDLYISMAQSIYHKEEISTQERHLGKAAILGCSYGLGYKKFRETCMNQGLEIDEVTAKRAVTAYRKKYSKIVRMWYRLESAAIEAVRTGKTISIGKACYGFYQGFLYCKLPAGRCLAYYQPETKLENVFGQKKRVLTYMGTNTFTKGFERLKTWGGTLFENIIQAIARDIMAAAMLRLDGKGYKIIMTVHDEIVAEVPDDFGSLDDFINMMVELPEWAKGCPVEAEGFMCERYKKG